jgi:hypothetical protein
LPYYQTGNTLGFEGNLPEPKDGTTCVRYLLKEPSGGIPKELFEEERRLVAVAIFAFSIVVPITKIILMMMFYSIVMITFRFT